MNRLRSIIFIFLISALMAPVYGQKHLLLVGTYTDKGTSEGIYVYEFDSNTGKVAYKNKATGIDNPSYLAISHNRKFVYAANEGKEGFVSAFAWNKKSGSLSFLGKQPANGTAPCYVAVDKNNQFLFEANYGSGNFSVYPILKNGAPGKAVQVIQHSGHGMNKERQEGPHVHSTILSPDEKYLMVSDLGVDKIYVYRTDFTKGAKPLTPAATPFVSTGQGNGPRHIDFHPNGKFVYSIQELTGNVTAFAYKNGELKTLQNLSMVSPDFRGRTGAADIHVSPDGRFLYTSNRGEANDMAVFAIDPVTGHLTLKGRTGTLGDGPRNFVIDPSGQFLLVANQNTDNIVIFKRDKETGLLTDSGERIEVGSPVCLKF